ncbi:MAG: PEGA domain-containing protein [Proteobacteria bacterium]|nr:PEGA domain-containing protein [Pseudomonadota bacterium]
MAYSRPASAQRERSTGRWLVVSALVGGQKQRPRQIARELAEVLYRRSTRAASARRPSPAGSAASTSTTAKLSAHALGLGPDEALKRFRQHGSSSPTRSDRADIERLAGQARDVLYYVAAGLNSEASRKAEQAVRQARKTLDSLNRDDRAARHLLDLCLYQVRASIQQHKRERALAQALSCQRLVPDLEPDANIHPAPVFGVLAEAEARLRARGLGSLRIQSEPAQCAVFLNGRPVGASPLELTELVPGDYLVQVECDPAARGRVHRVAISNAREALRVRQGFDRVIQTEQDLFLRYATRANARARQRSDALETARIVGASDVVLVHSMPARSATVIHLDRYRVGDGRQLAALRLELTRNERPARARLERLVDALQLSQPSPAQPPAKRPVVSPGRETGERPREPGPAPAAARARADRPLPIARVAGWALAGAGLLASGLGWGLHVRLQGLHDDYAVAVQNGKPHETQLKALAASEHTPRLVTASAAALLTGSLPFWLPERADQAWWSWLSGAAGLGVGVAGALLAIQESRCGADPAGRCRRAELNTHLGSQLLLQAVPLLAVPVVYAARGSQRTQDRAASGWATSRWLLRIRPRAAELCWHGTL